MTLEWNTADGTAIAGSDYVGTSGTVQFLAGETSKPITVLVNGDSNIEPDETLLVNLTLAAGAAMIADPTSQGTIIGDDIAATKFFVVDDKADQTFEYDAVGSALSGETWNLDGANAAARGAVSVDGSTMWVVDSGKKVYVYDGDGALQGSWSAKGGLKTPQGIASDGTDVWIVDAFGDKALRYSGGASRISRTQGASSSFSLAATNPSGITTNGTSIWIVDSGTDTVYRYGISGGTPTTWPLTAGNSSPTGITIDLSGASNSIWVVDNGSDTVYEYDRDTGALLGSFTLDTGVGNTNPQGIADPPGSAADISQEPTGQRCSIGRTHTLRLTLGERFCQSQTRR